MLFQASQQIPSHKGFSLFLYPFLHHQAKQYRYEVHVTGYFEISVDIVDRFCLVADVVERAGIDRHRTNSHVCDAHGFMNVTFKHHQYGICCCLGFALQDDNIIIIINISFVRRELWYKEAIFSPVNVEIIAECTQPNGWVIQSSKFGRVHMVVCQL